MVELLNTVQFIHLRNRQFCKLLYLSHGDNKKKKTSRSLSSQTGRFFQKESVGSVAIQIKSLLRNKGRTSISLPRLKPSNHSGRHHTAAANRDNVSKPRTSDPPAFDQVAVLGFVQSAAAGAHLFLCRSSSRATPVAVARMERIQKLSWQKLQYCMMASMVAQHRNTITCRTRTHGDTCRFSTKHPLPPGRQGVGTQPGCSTINVVL